MSAHSCGCKTSTCGCCEGTRKWTPAGTWNRPGLAALLYRVGAHGEFFESMKARLSTMSVDAPGADAQTIETFYPLAGFTARGPSDPSIALLDGWAVVGDVLTFYQERIANEGYLRTATERRSVLELARLTGYSLRPGVASTVYLAYILDDNQADPVEIPIGSRSQSIPAPGEFPQSFETAEKLTARTAWNNLQIRLSRPQSISLGTVLDLSQLFAGGTSTNLKPGDKLLFEFAGPVYAIRVVSAATPDFTNSRTQIQLQALSLGTPEAFGALAAFLTDAAPLITSGSSGGDRRFFERAVLIRDNTLLGLYSNPAGWVNSMHSAADVPVSPALDALGSQLQAEITGILQNTGSAAPALLTDPSKFVKPLLVPPVPQARSSARLARTLSASFQAGRDTTPQLLVNFEPRIRDTYYAAWSSASVNATAPALSALYALRVAAPLFGATVQRMAAFDANNKLLPPNQWLEWDLDSSERSNSAFLDQLYDTIAPGSRVVIQSTESGGNVRKVRTVVAAEGGPRTAYGFSGKSTRLTLDADWWFGSDDSMSRLRSAVVYGQAEALEVPEEPVTADAGGQEYELAALHNELASGRWVILSGERTDIPGVTGVRASELMMISGLRHGYDPALAGDKTHTTLILATPSAFTYKRSSLTIYGNVVRATHGETRFETLGGGSGAQTLQTFTLKQPPLTFVPAPTVSGVESTLHVYVNDVEWRQQPALAGAGPQDRIFITKTDNDDKTSVIFGDGVQGSRLPTGIENVRAQYRNGIGKPGNVKAEQISLVLTKPLGVKSVVNPLRASGGADRESLDQARENAPLAVMSLDRLVSLKDYEDFTRTFAGIGKAAVKRMTDGKCEFLHLTIAGADDIPIDPVSDLYQNLTAALRKYGDPDLPVRVDPRELIALVAGVNIRLAPDYLWDPVSEQVRSAILTEFGFSRRNLAQPALMCELIRTIQLVPGVDYVDVDTFGGVPEKATFIDPLTKSPERRLLTPDEMSARVLQIQAPPAGTGTASIAAPPPPFSGGVAASDANIFHNIISPAQLAIFTPAVPDTLILNQIV